MKRRLYTFPFIAVLLAAALPVAAQEEEEVEVQVTALKADTLVFVHGDDHDRVAVIKTRKTGDDSTTVVNVKFVETGERMELVHDDESFSWIEKDHKGGRPQNLTVEKDGDDIRLSIDRRSRPSAMLAHGAALRELRKMHRLPQASLRAESTEIMEREEGVTRLAMDASRAESGDRDELVADLREKLTELFELKQEFRRSRIDELREELAEMEQQFGERQALATEIIQRRLDELMGVHSKYDW